MPEDKGPGEVDLRLFRIWLKASRSVFGRATKDIESRGIRTEHFMILELLYNTGPQPVQRISERLSIPSGSITYVVDKLEEKGLVCRQPSQTDRRGMTVLLSEAGEALFNAIFPQHASLISRLLSAATVEEKRVLAELLKKIGLSAESMEGKE